MTRPAPAPPTPTEPRRHRLPVLHGVGGREVAARTSLARVFTVGAAALALAGVVAITVGAVALTGLTGARSDLLDRVSPAVDAGQRLSPALLDQETGVRGFGLTGREEFLDPYRAGIVAETGALDVLAAHADPDQMAAADAVTAAAQLWRDRYAEPTVQAVRAGTPVPDPVAGRALFDDVRARVDALVEDLRADQRAARDAVGAAASFLLAAAIAVAVVLVAMLVAAAVGLRRTVLGPVSALAEQVRAVVSGSGTDPVETSGPREIAQLGADVEAMRLRILADLEESQAVNRRLDAQAQDLERSNRDLEQFAYVASHDLQEPLRKVSSFCQLLQRRYGGQLDDRADQYIAFAVDGAQRMQQLINDLLAFSRVGRTTEDFTPVALAEVVAAAVTQLDAARAGVDGEIVVGELPTVPGDVTLLRQLFVNVLGNGLKFHRDGVPPVVRVESRRVDGDWEIVIADNGIGIDAEYADKVFVIFQRLHARDVYPGTGIGLALTKKIVEFHGGRVRLDHPDGPGATIVLTLPASERAVSER